MSSDAVTRAQVRLALLAKTAPWLLALLSALVGILLVELFCWLFVPSIGWNVPGRDNRIVFFDGDTPIFQNHGDIFTYLPHTAIRNLTAFFSSDAFRIEYDYRFRTNNLGLVQDADVAPGRKSLLLLGDSFTEGQGAEPWFRLVSPTIEKLGYQPVNGGVLGTGFQQWLRLSRYLAKNNIDVQKVIVLFISDDYHRPVWSIPPEVFQCLSSPPLCRIEQSYFYRLPAKEEMASWIARVKEARRPTRHHLKLSASALLPASFSVYTYLKQLLTFAMAEPGSREAISGLIETYGRENVAFLQLPQKNEIDREPDALGFRARHAIEDAGGRFFDGFKLCGLTMSDYYANDDHPNTQGYVKIATCAAKLAGELISGHPQEE